MRLFVSWHYMWPNPPAPFGQSSPTPYGAPAPDSPANVSQVLAQLQDLDDNILTAKNAGRQVILTTIHYPKWLNGTDPTSTTEPGTDPRNLVLPPDNALMLPTGTPPNGQAYLPTDFMYYQWINFLIYRYHRNSPSFSLPPTSFPPPAGAYIDALELVNEPNLSTPAGTVCSQSTTPPFAYSCPSTPTQQATLAHSTVLMMQTAQALNSSYNTVYGHYLKLLGPATADSGISGPANWNPFTTAVINALTANGTMPIRDPDFGWSHQNYTDVELIGRTIASLGSSFPPSLLNAIASVFYGPKTQDVRTILTGKWFGWGTPGSRGLFDTDPFIFLTEGGARLDALALALREPPPNPNGTSSPETVRLKQLQKYSVGGAADALQGGAGGGVEMFTNFLFFDDYGGNFSGLCDQYGPGRRPVPAPNETPSGYERPVYAAWKKFGL